MSNNLGKELLRVVLRPLLAVPVMTIVVDADADPRLFGPTFRIGRLNLGIKVLQLGLVVTRSCVKGHILELVDPARGDRRVVGEQLRPSSHINDEFQIFFMQSVAKLFEERPEIVALVRISVDRALVLVVDVPAIKSVMLGDVHRIRDEGSRVLQHLFVKQCRVGRIENPRTDLCCGTHRFAKRGVPRLHRFLDVPPRVRVPVVDAHSLCSVVRTEAPSRG